MALGHTHASKYSFFWVMLILSILICILPQKTTNTLNFLFKSLFGRILKIGVNITPETPAGTTSSQQSVSRNEYDLLWKNYVNLQAQMSELEKENLSLSRIRRQFGFSGIGLLSARVTTLSLSTRHELIIDQGTHQNVAVGQIVLSPKKDSVVGIVREVSETMSRVGLLTDSAVSIEVRIRRADSRMDIPAQMFGDGKSGCRIRFIQRDKDIRQGDIVYAATRPGKLDVPIVIGRVREVKADEQNPSLWSISVEPIEPAVTLNEVIVLIPLSS